MVLIDGVLSIGLGVVLLFLFFFSDILFGLYVFIGDVVIVLILIFVIIW